MGICLQIYVHVIYVYIEREHAKNLRISKYLNKTLVFCKFQKERHRSLFQYYPYPSTAFSAIF